MATIFKRRKKFSVIYWYDVPGEVDEKGNQLRKQKWETFKTHAEALSRKKEIEYQQEKKTFTPPTNMTVSELLMQYFDVYGTLKWSYKTYAGYESKKVNYIDPYIGNMPVKDLTTLYLDQYYQMLLDTNAVGRNNQKSVQKVSAKTIQEIHKLLRGAFNKAIAWEIVSKNPCAAATPPTYETPEKLVLCTEDVLNAIALCHDPLLKICMHLGFACTMRLGEILGLTWDAIDVSDESLENDYCSLHVNKILQRVELAHLAKLNKNERNRIIYQFPTCMKNTNSVLVLKRPKTKKSERRIWIPRTPALLLRQHYADQQERKELLGPDVYIDHNLVIAGSAGQPVEHRTIYKAMEELVEQYNVPKVVFHSLRHSSTTVKLKITGNDLKAVEGDNGHANSNMVLNTYSHIMDKDRVDTARKFQSIIYENGGEATVPLDEASQLLQILLTNPSAIQNLATQIGKIGGPVSR